MYTPTIWSGHESHRPIRLEPVAKQIVVNFGNAKPSERFSAFIFINTTEAVANVKDKLRMKQLMKWRFIHTPQFGKNILKAKSFPIVIKMNEHSGGRGMELIKTKAELLRFIVSVGSKANQYYYERFIKFDREFRVHCSQYSQTEVFATEKVKRNPNDKNWIMNLKSCEYKKDFEKPDLESWRTMLKHCRRTLRACKLDIGGFDVAYKADEKKFYIIELNSACGMHDNTRAAYVKELNKICKLKSK